MSIVKRSVYNSNEKLRISGWMWCPYSAGTKDTCCQGRAAIRSTDVTLQLVSTQAEPAESRANTSPKAQHMAPACQRPLPQPWLGYSARCDRTPFVTGIRNVPTVRDLCSCAVHSYAEASVPLCSRVTEEPELLKAKEEDNVLLGQAAAKRYSECEHSYSRKSW